MISRRHALAIVASAAAATATFRPALAQNVPPADLAQPGPLGDVWQGAETAKATII